MKQVFQKPILLLLSMLLILGTFGAPVFAADVNGFDISMTKTSLAIGETTPVVCKTLNSDGTLSDYSGSVTFESGNPYVAEVSEAGVVTAKNEGIAKVTARVGISTQSLFFIVTNQAPRVDQGFEEEETTVRNCFSANNPSIKFLDTYEFVTSPVRSGASALQAKTIVDANLTGGQRAKLNVISVPGFADPEPGSTEETGPAYRSRGVLELWFYDDMNPLKNNALEIFSQKGGDGNYDGDTFPTGVAVNPNKDCWANALRGYLNLGGTQYTFSGMGAETTQYYGPYIVNPIDRTMGWHQIIIDYTQDEAYTIYIDGQLMMTRSTPGFNSNGGLATIDISRYGASTVAGQKDHVTTFDDILVYKMKPTAEPPQVTGVTIGGKASVGANLQVEYSYYDPNGDEEDLSRLAINWYSSISANADNWGAPIATGSSYVVKESDMGKYIKAEVVAYSAAEPFESNIASAMIGPVTAKPALDNQTITKVDLSNNKTLYKEGDQGEKLSATGASAAGDFDLDGYVTYSSDDNYVASIDEEGRLTIHNPGYAIVTGVYTNSNGTKVEGKVIIHVYRDGITMQNFENYTIPDPTLNVHVNLSEDLVRSGSKALALQQPDAGATAVKYGFDLYANYKRPSNVAEIWFYDSGDKANARASVYLQGDSKLDDGTPSQETLRASIGILDDTKDYYMYANLATGRANMGAGGVNLKGTPQEGTGYLGDQVTAGSVLLDGNGGRPRMPRSKGWHQVVMVVNGGDDYSKVGTDQGTVTLYLDGHVVYVEKYVIPYLNVLRAQPVYAAGSDHRSYYDDMAMYRYYIGAHPPIVSDAKAEGAAMVGSTLTAAANVSDRDGDELAPTTYQWQRYVSNQWVDIAGATGESYVVKPEDLGYKLRVVVTPHSTVAPVDGEPVASGELGPVIEQRTPPGATTVSITGNAKIGDVVEVLYTYVKNEGSDPEGNSKFIWERSADGNTWEVIPNESEKYYSPVLADKGKYIRGSVIPTDVNGLTGTAVVSANTLQVGEEMAFFVATNGDDNNTGSFTRPFATIGKARDTIRQLKAGQQLTGEIVVNIRGGEYFVNEAISFTAADSGTESSPIIYQAYNGEKVQFIGGVKIDNSKVSYVTDVSILNRVLDDYARTQLMQIDLSDVPGVIEPIADHGYGVGEQNVPKDGKHPARAQYKPLEIYVGGEALKKSRWPNDEPGTGYIRTGAASSSDPDNYRTSPFTVEYIDPDNRTQKWSPDAYKDLYLTGFIGTDWADATHKIGSLDVNKKTLTSINGTRYMPSANHRLFFFNLIEEIDMPGESYIDRENKIAYFYPKNDAEAEDIIVSTLTDDMFQFGNVSYMTIKDLDIGYTRGNGVYAYPVDNFTIDGLTISHTSSNAALLRGTNSIIKNCHIFDTAGGGVSVNGGNRKTLTPGNIVAENNRIHSVTRIYNSYRPAIDMDGVGTLARNNEVYDSPHEIITLDGNDLVVENNEIYNAVLDAADMGAIYWGRNPSQIGYQILGNYFHHIGNKYGGYGQQSVFWDDGATGPYAYGNIFYQGSLPIEEGGTRDRSYAMKTNGGQFAWVENNIFIDSPRAVWFQDWGIQNWWLHNMDAWLDGRVNGVWSKMTEETDCFGDLWKEHYKDTMWAEYWNMSINQKTYEELQGYYQARNKTAIYNLASKPGHAPTVPKNVFQNNVAIKVEETWKNSSGIAFSGSGVGNAGYAARDDKLPSGESMFVDYGKDFQLTEAGLAAVREKIPDFENIDTSKIGLQPYLDNGVERYVGGRVPSASNATVSGTGETWDTVEAAYTFTDPDGDEEGVSEIVWYISSRENGTYTRLSGKQGKRLMIDPSYAEQYIRYEIKPYDSQGVYGETVTSATIRLPKADPMNTLALRTALTRARDALAKANIGSGVGQTPQSAANTLQGLIDETVILLADSEKTQAQISRQTERLEIGLIRFNNSRNVEEISLNSALADTANWKVGVGTDEIRFQDGAILLNNTSRGDYNVVYEGREYRDQVLKFKYKVDDLGDGTVGFFLRQQDKDVMPGETAAYGFMINKDNFELRSYQPDGLLTTAVRNEKTVDGETVPLFEAGKEYTMTVGAYDEGDAVRLVMKVGDDTIFDFLHESGNTAVPTTLNGLSGYLAAYTGAGLSAQLMPIAADKSQLRSAIDNATATRAGLSVGDRYAQHPQSAADEFDAILASAEAVASNIDALQETVDNMVFELNAALNDLLGNKNAVGALESGESVNYEYDIAGRSTFNIPQDAKNVYLRVDSAREHNFVVNKQIGSSQLTMTVAQGTTVSANGWDGTILLPEQSDTSSATVEGRIASVFKLGSASGINASKPVRIVLPGMASYSIGYVRNGKLTRISERLSEDSMDAAEAALTNNKPAAYMKAGNDMVVWTNQLTELVCYTAENNNTNNNGGGGNVSGPSTSGVSNSGTSSNGLLGQSNTTKFIDIIGHWAKDDIENLYAKGIVTGVTEITFEPDRSVTRAEFATLITKALNLTSDVSQGFEDVRIGEWHYSFVNAAANAGLIVGYDGYFRPDDYITREEMAVIIAKAFAYRGKTAGSGGIEKFTDKGEISDWAYSYVDSVTTAGLISGMTPTTFVAGANTTRAQSASVIRRLLDN